MQQILEDVLAGHPLVLDDPEPTVAVQELGDFSVNFICRPWTATDNYWQVYREITRMAKDRFSEAGLVPPMLQHKVPVARTQPHDQPPVTPVSTG